jgi:putative cell wall-binding protein
MWSNATDTSAGARHAQAVVLATGASFPDALAGGPLASVVHGPLLLTDPGALPPETLTELQRVLPAHAAKPVYVLGGPGAVKNAVTDQLTALGYSVHRLGGQTRFDTARAIATEYVKDSPNPAAAGQQAVVATGLNFADALSAGPLASLVGAPIILTNGASLDPDTAKYLAGKNLLPVGGPAYTATGIKPYPDSSDFCLGLAGTDRYDTNARVAKCMILQGSYLALGGPTVIGVATGANFPDALTGGAWLGQLRAPLLLTEPGSLSAPADGLLTSWWKLNLRSVDLFGGIGALSGNVENQIVASLGASDLKPL